MILKRLLLICALLATMFATASAGIKGDVTGDARVDISDVNAVINVVLGKVPSTAAADVNGDYSVDISDVNLVINIMLGKITPKTFETIEDVELAIDGCAYTMMRQYLYTQGFSGEGGILMFYGNYPGQDFYVNLPGWAPLINHEFYETTSSRYNYYPWYYYYCLIDSANKVIMHYDEPEGNEAKKQFLKAQALTFRAYAYTMLSQLYCVRWVDSNAGAASGLKLRLDESFIDLPVSTLAETYAQIYSDLDEAIALFEQCGLSHPSELFYYVCLPDIEVAYAVYARAALVKNDWANAAKYAELARNKHPLMTNEQLLDNGFCWANTEWIWGGYRTRDLYYYSYHAYIGYTSKSSAVRIYPKCISRELFEQIPTTDVRRQWWLDPTGYDYNTSNGLAAPTTALAVATHEAKPDLLPNSQVYAYMQWKVRTIDDPDAPGLGDLCIFRSSEMLLIEAEAECMMGNNTKAQSALVALNKTSGRDPQYTCTKTGAELLNEVKLYRRIELWGEGFDWFDLKRWKQPLVCHTYEDGGNFLVNFAITINPDEKNNWTYVIPSPEDLPQE